MYNYDKNRANITINCHKMRKTSIKLSKKYGNIVKKQ